MHITWTSTEFGRFQCRDSSKCMHTINNNKNRLFARFFRISRAILLCLLLKSGPAHGNANSQYTVNCCIKRRHSLRHTHTSAFAQQLMSPLQPRIRISSKFVRPNLWLCSYFEFYPIYILSDYEWLEYEWSLWICCTTASLSFLDAVKVQSCLHTQRIFFFGFLISFLESYGIQLGPDTICSVAMAAGSTMSVFTASQWWPFVQSQRSVERQNWGSVLLLRAQFVH